MYSVFFSRMEMGTDSALDRLREIIKPSFKVAIFPWAFKEEISAFELENDFFRKGSPRYNRYVLELKKTGISEDNITVCNCYSDSSSKLRDIISCSDVLLLPGGNPEMFFKKVVYDTEILYDIRHFKGIIIGESAGCELQLTRYFITAKNNYYKYFAFYDGFGVINNSFYIDVHTVNNRNYLNKLQKVSNEKKADIYAIYDDGVVIYDRLSGVFEVYGNVKLFKPMSD